MNSFFKKTKASKGKKTQRKRGKDGGRTHREGRSARGERQEAEETTAVGGASVRNKKPKDKTKRAKKTSHAKSHAPTPERERGAVSPGVEEKTDGYSREAVSVKGNLTTTTSTTSMTQMTQMTQVGAPGMSTLSNVTTMSTLSTKTTPLGQPTTAETPGWLGEPIARGWMEKVDFQKTKGEYERLQEMVVNVEADCKKWQANLKLVQGEDFPVLDANLVKCDMAFVNMSHVEVPLHRNVVMGQIPVKGSEEAFWRAVFDARAIDIHLLTGEGETIEFFPQKGGDFTHFGSMFVNNRKVTTVTEDVTKFAVEVLPEGCSNSIVCNVTLIKSWNIDSVHSKHSSVIKETIELNNYLSTCPPDETALIVSKHGAGRAGYFVALAVAVTKMDQRLEPNLFEIVKAIRSQRPKAVDSLTQYASLYIAMFYYIKRKTTKAVDGDKKAVADPNEPICKKSLQLTALFTAALLDEAAAGGNPVMSTPK